MLDASSLVWCIPIGALTIHGASVKGWCVKKDDIRQQLMEVIFQEVQKSLPEN